MGLGRGAQTRALAAFSLLWGGCPSPAVDSDTDLSDSDAMDSDGVVDDTDPVDTDSGVDSDDPVPTTTEIAQYGVVWTFDSPVRYGAFANGDPWVVGPVTLVGVSPSFDGAHHGWEVNPDDPVSQGFDSRIADFDATRVPTLPLTLVGPVSVVQAVSIAPLDATCRPCLQTAAVLTVLTEPPPDDGATVFRPPYFGADKPLRRLDELHLDGLPSLAPPVDAPSIAAMAGAFQRVQLDHKTNWTGRHLHPVDNLPDYGSDIASRNAEGALRLMLDDDIADKQPLVVNYVQYGLDLYGMMAAGVTWPANGGHDEGRKLPIAVAALLLDDAALRDAVADAPIGTFGEDEGVYVSPRDPSRALYGPSDGEEAYWRNVVFDQGSRTVRDPYGWIDGGWRPADSYQYCCLSMVWKSTSTALLLLPELQTTWDRPEFLGYASRWVAEGAWTQPDPCAPPVGTCAGGDVAGLECTTANERAVCVGDGGHCDLTGAWDANYGVTYGPDGLGGCVLDVDPTDGIGRFPDRHGEAADQGYYQSAFANAMWDAYLR